MEATNNGNPTPSIANTPWSSFQGFGQAPLYLGARICNQPGCARNEWLGYLSSFVIYQNALSNDCAFAIFDGMAAAMPQQVPHGVDGACQDWRDKPVETESSLTTGAFNAPTLGGDVHLTTWGLHFVSAALQRVRAVVLF